MDYRNGSALGLSSSEPKPVRESLLQALQRLRATERVVPRIFPRADFLIALGRFGASCPALVLLSVGIANFCDTLEVFVIILSTFIITFSGREIGLLFRDSMALSDFHKTIERQTTLKVYGLRDYFPSGLAANIIRDYRIILPDYTLLYSSEYEKYAALQYSLQKSFITVPFEPNKSSPISLFYLLHELGHIGKKDYLTRDVRFAVIWHVTFAVITLFLFASPNSWHAYVLWIFITNAVVQFSVRSMRLESEIEADHLALIQIFFSWCIKSLHDQFSRSEADILADPKISPPDDQKMSKDDEFTRNDIFERMRADAQNSELTFADFYIWLGVRSQEYKGLIIALTVLSVTAYLEPLRRVGISWISLMAVMVFLFLALLLSIALKHRNLRLVNSLIQAKAHTNSA